MTITVLISGRGSNMVAIHEACLRGDLTAPVTHVISNNPNAPGLEYASRHGIPCTVLDHRSFTDRQTYDNELLKLIEATNPSLVLLAGFMRKLSGDFTRYFTGRLLNIHPSLLPRHPGLDTHVKVIRGGDRWHGCSVHFVTEVLDGGPLIARSVVPVLPGDTAELLAGRVLEKEHRIYWRVAQLITEGSVRWRNGHVEYCRNQLGYPLLFS